MIDLITLYASYLNFLMLYFIWTFLGFVFVIKIKNKTTKGTWPRKIGMLFLGWPFIIFLDWPLNMLSSLVFLDIPKNKAELFTGRMKRYKKLNKNKSFMNLLRNETANFVCPLLNFFDKEHC